jgi:CheY-like chemotaxis protein
MMTHGAGRPRRPRAAGARRRRGARPAARQWPRRAGERHRPARQGRLRTGAHACASRKRAGTPRLPMIALTAFARPEDQRKTLDAGFDLHLASRSSRTSCWLGDVVVEAGRARRCTSSAWPQPVSAISRHRRAPGLRADAARHFVAVQARHADVQHGDVGPQPPARQRLLAVGRGVRPRGPPSPAARPWSAAHRRCRRPPGRRARAAASRRRPAGGCCAAA